MFQRFILKFLFCVSAIAVLNSCENANRKTVKEDIKVVDGDLYFKLIDFGFFKEPDSAISKFEKEIWRVDKRSFNEQDTKFYTLVQYMSKHKLLRKPFIRIRSDNGDIKIFFTSTSDYKQFEQYNWRDLNVQNKKVRIKAEVIERKNTVLPRLELRKILSVNKINGRTHMEK